MTRAVRMITTARLSIGAIALIALFASLPRQTEAAPPRAAPAAASASSAAPSPSAAHAKAPPSGNAVSPSGSGMSHVVARLAAEIGNERAGSVVATAPLQSDEPAPRGAELTAKLTALLAGKVAGGATAKRDATSLAAAQAAARRATWLVYLQSEIARGQLKVTADVYQSSDNVWERARDPIPAPVAHA